MYNIFKTIQFICSHANDNIASYLSESYVVDKEKILQLTSTIPRIQQSR
jgi:hypothetical protein